MSIHTKCAISGITFKIAYSYNIEIPVTTGYYHPIFTLNSVTLYNLYESYTYGKLNNLDSYLLYLAILNSTGKIHWKSHIKSNPEDKSTQAIIANNIGKLIEVIAKTDSIKRVSFKQPEFCITKENNTIESTINFIKAWEENIEDFLAYSADARDRASLLEVENKLSRLILSGNKPESYAAVIADWAAIAGNFPEDSKELWVTTIRASFNKNKMFKTPLSLLKEIKTYCECNIEAGSIHFHSLMETLTTAVVNHLDYLGGTNPASSYTLLPEMITSKQLPKEVNKDKAALDNVISKAPEKLPEEKDYSSKLDFIKAKLAYRASKLGRDK